MIGLVGQGMACCGVAFSQSFTAAVIWRGLGGAVNATVGGARTALSEATPRKYHSRTFLVLPLAWNIANFLGPMVGGLLSDPVANYPGLFGEGGLWFGGEDGVGWMKAFPYAAPNLFCALVCWADAGLLFFGLRETLAARQGQKDFGSDIVEHVMLRVGKVFFRRSGYSEVGQDESNELGFAPNINDTEEAASTPLSAHRGKDGSNDNDIDTAEDKPAVPPSFMATLTRNVLCVLLTVAFLDFQMSGFTSLWTVFLSSSVRTASETEQISLPFHFAGGIAMSPSTIGVAMSFLGVAGIICQLTLYPRANARFGLLRCTRWSLFVFPVAYLFAPYLSLLINHRILLWCGIVLVVTLQVFARTFAVPGVVLLTNNATPDPAVLGTIHGMGAATSSLFRTMGPIVVGHWYSTGLEEGVVGKAWWLLSLIAVVGIGPSYFARDGR